MKKPKAKTPSKISKGKRKEGESPSSTNTESDGRFNSEPPKFSSEEKDNSENGSSHSKGMSKLEQRLEAGESLTLPSIVGHVSLPSQIQGTDPSYFRR